MSEYLEEVWQSEIEVMDVIFDICQKYNLRCYLAYGTLIGAVRHKGFIPWDDDVDLVMPRPDYEKFCRVASEHLPAHMKLNRYNIKNQGLESLPSSTLKVEDIDCKILRTFGTVEKWANAWVDIWPLDGMPEGKIKLSFYKFNVLLRLCLCRLCDLEVKGVSAEDNTFIEKLIINANRILKLGKIMNREKRYQSFEHYLKKFNYDKCPKTVMIMGEERFNINWPVEYYGEAIALDFEKKKYPVPKRYNQVLKIIFGDYMQLPPEEKRVCRHIVKVCKGEKHE